VKETKLMSTATVAFSTNGTKSHTIPASTPAPAPALANLVDELAGLRDTLEVGRRGEAALDGVFGPEYVIVHATPAHQRQGTLTLPARPVQLRLALRTRGPASPTPTPGGYR
jgi:hypothetical protein